jgi:hypothetical protein
MPVANPSCAGLPEDGLLMAAACCGLFSAPEEVTRYLLHFISYISHLSTMLGGQVLEARYVFSEKVTHEE